MISRSLNSKFGLNFLGYGYAQLVTLAVQLLLVPFFLQSWGAELYAEWLVLTGLPTILILADFGVAQVSASKATIAAGANDWSAARVILQTSMVFSVSVSLLILAVFYVLTLYVDWSVILKLGGFSRGDSACIMLIMVACVGLNILSGPVDALFRTVDRVSLGAFLLANRRAIDVVVSIFILARNGSPLDLAVWLLCSQVIMLIFCAFVASRCTDIISFGFSGFSLVEFRSLIKPAVAYMSFPVSQALTLQGGLQVLNQLSDTKTIVMYSMARTLMRLVLQVGVVANHALKPELSRMIGAGRRLQAYNFTMKLMMLTLLLSFISYSALLVFGPDIMYWWGQGHVYVSSKELLIIGSHALVHVAWFVPAAYLIAENKHGRVALAYSVGSLLAMGAWLINREYLDPFVGASFLLLLPELLALVVIGRTFFNMRKE